MRAARSCCWDLSWEERRYSILLNTGSIVSPSRTLCHRSLVPIFSTSLRPLGSIFSRHSRSQPATSPGLPYFSIVVEVEEALIAWEAGYRDVGWKLSPTCPFQTIQPASRFLLASFLGWLLVPYRRFDEHSAWSR